MTGAVVIIGAMDSKPHVITSNSRSSSQIRVGQTPVAGVELLGRSVLARTVEELSRAGFDFVKVCGNSAGSELANAEEDPGFFTREVWRDAEEEITDLKELGAEAVLVLHLGTYIEFEPMQMLQFHYGENAALSRACDQQGALDLWIVNPNRIPSDQPLSEFLEDESASYYQVQGYVNRLENGRDIRRLVADSFGSRCQFRPQGFEVRPGVWMAAGAEVARGARIVAPAYIGRGVKIADQCLITRCSNVESNSQVDYGSAVEDSSVLGNTYVGIGLDLSHSVVDGNCLINLRHDVMLEIADPAVLRRLREARARDESDRQLLADLNFGEMAMSAGEQGRR